jgi:hypothetical protein
MALGLSSTPEQIAFVRRLAHEMGLEESEGGIEADSHSQPARVGFAAEA